MVELKLYQTLKGSALSDWCISSSKIKYDPGIRVSENTYNPATVKLRTV